MKIQHQLSIATLLMAGVFVTGCSQQQVAGGSQQSAGGSQVAGGSQAQIEGGSQQASSQQQVDDKVVAPVATPRPAPAPRPAYTAPAPKPRMAGNCHTHPANSRTKSVRHCHPNPTGQHRYAGGGRKHVGGGNRWTHNHPEAPACAKTKRHTHKFSNKNHRHQYSCQKSYNRPAAAPRAQQPKVDVYALQRKLKAKGYYKGPIDGVVGPGTRGALKKFMNR